MPTFGYDSETGYPVHGDGTLYCWDCKHSFHTSICGVAAPDPCPCPSAQVVPAEARDMGTPQPRTDKVVYE